MAPRKRNNPVGSAISRSPKSKRQRQHQAPPAETYPIPDRLQDVFERVERKKSAFELKFPINDLNGVQRLAWGLDRRADFVIVNLEFLQEEDKSSGYARFCVHSSTDREKRSHSYSATDKEASSCIKNPCSPRSTILTCVLSRELFGIVGLRCCRDLGTIYDRAFELIKSDPTERCLICGKLYEVKVYTPTACLGECMKKLEEWPLRARLSHLLSDTKVLDIMLCCIYTAVRGQQVCPDQYGTESSLLVDCPLKLPKIRPTIDSFPEISDELGMHQLVNSGDTRIASSQKRHLLSWLALRLRGCIVSLPHDAEFFMQEPYDVEAAGVYYSDDPGYSYSYTERDIPLQAWKRSQFFGQGWSVLFGLEVALSQIPFAGNEHSTRRESTLMIRYIFLLPSYDPPRLYCDEDYTDLLQIDQDAMKKAYDVLDRNTLSPRHIGLGVRHETRGKSALPESQKDT
ncbi:hypothetical protein SLS64_000790 [Diaporthe eres]|uniref:Uncharacterized protein n=1 Tax=Diaporthe eres TaxID=83184 RepID=A0ABR1NRS4_DIAER